MNLRPGKPVVTVEKEMLVVSIGRIARRCRRIMHVTQEEVSEVLGLTCEYYARIERSQSMPGIRAFCKMVSLFGISADVLLGFRAMPGAYDGPPRDRIPGDLATSNRWDAASTEQWKKLLRRLRRSRSSTLQMLDWVLSEVERTIQLHEDGNSPRGGDDTAKA